MISDDSITNNSSKEALITINSLIDYGQTTIKNNLDFLNKLQSGQLKIWTKRSAEEADTKKHQYVIWLERIDKLLYELQLKEEAEMIKQSFANLQDNNFDPFYLTEIIATLNSIKENLQNDNLDNKIDLKIQVNNSDVFIVHGHSELLISQTESFLRQLGLNPIILREQVNQGQTIIEKFEKYTDVAFAIVLYTACDYGCTKEDKGKEDKLRPRARQNVVFEHGYLNAKLGRKKVCALVEDGVEFPSDLSGFVYISIDKNGKWKLDLAKELHAAKMNVDMNKLL